MGDKCKLMQPKEPRVGDKGETSVNSCGPMSGRQGGDNCKLMRPKEPRVGHKCGRQVWETRSVNSCGPRNPEWETRRPKEPRVGDKFWRQVWETSGRQV